MALFGEDRQLLLPIDLDKALYYNSTKTWGAAGYGQITVKDLLPGLMLTIGLRYDYEKVKLSYRGQSTLSRRAKIYRLS